jgi:hypothetical protein
VPTTKGFGFEGTMILASGGIAAVPIVPTSGFDAMRIVKLNQVTLKCLTTLI